MTSTRLPGKVLKSAAGKPLLAHHVERLRRAARIDELVVATTANATDDVTAEWCSGAGVAVFRGSEHDVLERYVLAARAHAADVVVRITSDCPLIDPAVVDRTVGAFLDAWPRFDYASNRIVKTYPRGLDTEVATLAALETAHSEAIEPPDREHVTFFIHRQPQRFRLLNVAADGDFSHHRWTVDTPEDFELVRRILEALYPTNPAFGMSECLSLLDANPTWMLINAHVEQKDPHEALRPAV